MKKISIILIILVLLLVARGIVLSIQNLVGTNSIGIQLKEDLTTKQRQNQLLTQKLSYVQSTDYIEKVARNQLGFTKANEQLVLAPTPAVTPPPQNIPQEKPNWQKWVDLFMKN